MTRTLTAPALVVSAAAALATLAPATAFAESTVRYTNRSGHPLHVYYSVAPHGSGIDCRDLTYGGTVAPGATWVHFVPDAHWTWVRFQEDPREGGCAEAHRYEVQYSGSAYGYQAANVW